jgi:hypothetical protein
MPTLAGFNGASIVPDVMGALRQGGQNIMAARSVVREMEADQLAQQAAAGDEQSLIQLGRIDPNAYKQVADVIASKDAARAASAQKQAEERGLMAMQFLEVPVDKRQQFLSNMAQTWSQEGRDLSELVKISGMNIDQQEQYAKSQLLAAVGAKKALEGAFPESEKYGLNVTTAYDDQGKPVLIQPSTGGKGYRVLEGVGAAGKPQVVELAGGVKALVNPLYPGKYTDLQGNEMTPELFQTLLREATGAKAGQESAVAGATAQAGAAGKAKGEREADVELNAPMAKAQAEGAIANLQAARRKVQKAKDQSNWKTTGIIGSFLKTIPGTDAFNLDATLEAVRSNIGFDTLVDLKKNGGTLGAVSEKELSLLLSKVTSLEQAQTQEQFQEGLGEVMALYDRLIPQIEADLASKYKLSTGGTPSDDTGGKKLSIAQKRLNALRAQKKTDDEIESILKAEGLWGKP